MGAWGRLYWGVRISCGPGSEYGRGRGRGGGSRGWDQRGLTGATGRGRGSGRGRALAPGTGSEAKLAVSAWRTAWSCCCSASVRRSSSASSCSRRSRALLMLCVCLCSTAFCSSKATFIFRRRRSSASRAAAGEPGQAWRFLPDPEPGSARAASPARPSPLCSSRTPQLPGALGALQAGAPRLLEVNSPVLPPARAPSWPTRPQHLLPQELLLRSHLCFGPRTLQ